MAQPTLGQIALLVQNRLPVTGVTNEVGELGPRLGAGAFGEVFPAEWTCPQPPVHPYPAINVVVKRLNGQVVAGIQWGNAVIWELFVQEVTAWLSIAPHENVLPLIGVRLVPGENPCLVSPRIDQPDLEAGLQAENANNALTYQRRCDIILDVANGLAHLHSAEINIVHGDLHQGNVFMHAGRAIIADFGLSKLADTDTIAPLAQLRNYLTIYDIVPELANAAAHRTQQVDIYMLGRIAQYILTFGVAQGQHPVELAYLTNQCCAENPADRPTAVQIIAQFTEFRNQ